MSETINASSGRKDVANCSPCAKMPKPREKQAERRLLQVNRGRREDVAASQNHRLKPGQWLKQWHRAVRLLAETPTQRVPPDTESNSAAINAGAKCQRALELACTKNLTAMGTRANAYKKLSPVVGRSQS